MIASPPRTRWRVFELEKEVALLLARLTGRDVKLGSLHVRVFGAIQQAIDEGVLRKVSWGVYETTSAWWPGHMAQTAVERALQSTRKKQFEGLNLGLGINIEKRESVCAVVMTKRATSVYQGLAEGLAPIRDFLMDHPGVIVFYSMRVKGLTHKGLKGRTQLVFSY